MADTTKVDCPVIQVLLLTAYPPACCGADGNGAGVEPHNPPRNTECLHTPCGTFITVIQGARAVHTIAPEVINGREDSGGRCPPTGCRGFPG